MKYKYCWYQCNLNSWLNCKVNILMYLFTHNRYQGKLISIEINTRILELNKKYKWLNFPNR